MPFVVVEYLHDPPLSADGMEKNSEKLEPCLDVRNVRWVTTYLAGDGRRQVCVFDAPDAESVREAYRSAGVAFERVWPATRIPS